MSLPKIGCQLIIFGGKYNVENDIEAIVSCLARGGYDAVEGGPRDAVRYRSLLDAHGLVYAGQHVALNSNPDWNQVADYVQTMGAADVCNSGFLKWGELSADDNLRGIELLNEGGAILRARGVRLHYHNHAFEFEKMDGERTGMDLLFEGLDPAACDFCVDMAWVHKGGADPVEFLQTHRDRIGYLHFKDFDAEGWCELGRGVVDFAAILPVVETMPGVRWVVVEQDNTRNEPMDSVTESRVYLREKFGY